ncbi:MAG: hypothetical protein Q9165_003830 [Trypethelium subeluteriae]
MALNTFLNISISNIQRQIEKTPDEPIAPPVPRGGYKLDRNVIKAFPIAGTGVVASLKYGQSLWGQTAKIVVKLPSGETDDYFLKVVALGDTGKYMCEGEYESPKAIYEVLPGFVPKLLAWGAYDQEDPKVYFLLAEFRDVGEQVKFFVRWKLE